MTKNKISKLKQDYHNACNAYVAAFEKKQGCNLEMWIGDEIGGVASFGDILCFSISDIIEDINSNYPKGLIIKWLEDTIDASYDKESNNYFDERPYINLKSYAMGARYDMLNINADKK